MALTQELVDSEEGDTVTTDQTCYCNNMQMGIRLLAVSEQCIPFSYCTCTVSYCTAHICTLLSSLLLLFYLFYTHCLFNLALLCIFFLAYITFYIVGILWTAKEKRHCTEKHVCLTVHMRLNTLNLASHGSSLSSAGVQLIHQSVQSWRVWPGITFQLLGKHWPLLASRHSISKCKEWAHLIAYSNRALHLRTGRFVTGETLQVKPN